MIAIGERELSNQVEQHLGGFLSVFQVWPFRDDREGNAGLEQQPRRLIPSRRRYDCPIRAQRWALDDGLKVTDTGPITTGGNASDRPFRRVCQPWPVAARL